MSTWRDRIPGWLRPGRARAGLVVGILAVTVILTPPIPERYGDRLQVALPLIALGCSVVNGSGGEFLLRYGVMFFTVHGSKRILGDAEINQRPHGGGHGFPSAHTSTAVLGASSIVHDCVNGHPVVQGVVLLAAGFTGASRIEANAHTIWQVLAGALWGWVCERAFRRSPRVRRPIARFFTMIAATIARATRFLYHGSRDKT